jgi:DNA processing protein
MYKLKLNTPALERRLSQLADPPKQLFAVGYEIEQLLEKPCVAIVGTRRPSSYGVAITKQLANELASANVVIISGLALGLDSIAHQSALSAGGYCIAVLPSPIDQIYPTRHRQLAGDIVKFGCLISERGPGGGQTGKHHFIARNRIIAALADIVVIPEAASKSGSLHTAMFALDLGRTVAAVPGPINTSNSQGTNSLIKTGALVVTEAADIFQALGINRARAISSDLDSEAQRQIVNVMQLGVSERGEIHRQTGLGIDAFLVSFTELELAGKIKPAGADNWYLSR